MTNLVLHRNEPSQAIALPLPGARVPGGIAIRVATLDDLKFIDALQKKHSKMVGFLFLESLEKKTKAGHVLIAEAGNGQSAIGNRSETAAASPIAHCPLPIASPLGYCIFQDKYDKHDDCGIFYQVNVVPSKQRGLIGAALVKAQLERAAYGCKLASCWCAQDLEANYFWESLGFVPLAFRTGSRPRMKKDGTVSKPERIHIFWQRRTREGDDSTPYWFPSETFCGSMREKRLVLPIPPGTHWSDAKPAILPGMENVNALPAAPGETEPKPRPRGRGKKPNVPILKAPKRKVGVWFVPPPLTAAEKKAAKAKDKPPKPPRVRFKNDPKMVAAARELRDRYIEQINTGLLLPPSACGKYDVSRQLEAAPSAMKVESARLLEAA